MKILKWSNSTRLKMKQEDMHLLWPLKNGLENTNAELIRMNIKQSDRLIRLNESVRNQMKALKNNKNIKELEVLQQQVNEDNKYLIDSK